MTRTHGIKIIKVRPLVTVCGNRYACLNISTHFNDNTKDSEPQKGEQADPLINSWILVAGH
jgi:hypothetical protein